MFLVNWIFLQVCWGNTNPSQVLVAFGVFNKIPGFLGDIMFSALECLLFLISGLSTIQSYLNMAYCWRCLTFDKKEHSILIEKLF